MSMKESLCDLLTLILLSKIFSGLSYKQILAMLCFLFKEKKKCPVVISSDLYVNPAIPIDSKHIEENKEQLDTR